MGSASTIKAESFYSIWRNIPYIPPTISDIGTCRSQEIVVVSKTHGAHGHNGKMCMSLVKP
jgi:hypothetical protein